MKTSNTLKDAQYTSDQTNDCASPAKLDQNVFLIGFMGCGKSTLASWLEQTYGLDIIEMDQLIAKQNGMSIAEIFATKGEEYFRSEETELLKNCATMKNKVISCGGGVVMRPVNVEEMKKSGKIVLLTAKPETILERTKDDHGRPLLENNKSVDKIAALMEARRPAYEAAAHFVIETDGKTTAQIGEELFARFNQ